MTSEEQRSYAELSFKKDSLISCIEAKQAQMEALKERLRSVNREQDEWIALFSLHHDVDVDTRRMQVDIIAGVVVLS